jgi:hypothetical protein
MTYKRTKSKVNSKKKLKKERITTKEKQEN